MQLYDGQTWFVKVHATFPALEKGAEDLLIRMPIQVIKLMIYTDRFSLSLSSLSLSFSFRKLIFPVEISLGTGIYSLVFMSVILLISLSLKYLKSFNSKITLLLHTWQKREKSERERDINIIIIIIITDMLGLVMKKISSVLLNAVLS